jgi:hypothetical protein
MKSGFVPVCTSTYLYVPVYILCEQTTSPHSSSRGILWYIIVCTGMYWYILVCTGLYSYGLHPDYPSVFFSMPILWLSRLWPSWVIPRISSSASCASVHVLKLATCSTMGPCCRRSTLISVLGHKLLISMMRSVLHLLTEMLPLQIKKINQRDAFMDSTHILLGLWLFEEMRQFSYVA